MNTPKRHAVAADSVFDGITVRHNSAVVIEGEHATVRLFSTPDDGSGARVLEFEHEFSRRTRLLQAAANGGEE